MYRHRYGTMRTAAIGRPSFTKSSGASPHHNMNHFFALAAFFAAAACGRRCIYEFVVCACVGGVDAIPIAGLDDVWAPQLGGSGARRQGN